MYLLIEFIIGSSTRVVQKHPHFVWTSTLLELSITHHWLTPSSRGLSPDNTKLALIRPRFNFSRRFTKFVHKTKILTQISVKNMWVSQPDFAPLLPAGWCCKQISPPREIQVLMLNLIFFILKICEIVEKNCYNDDVGQQK